MKDLIAALESASGPDRELDARIRGAVFGDFAFCDLGEGHICEECINRKTIVEEGCGGPVGIFDERTSYPRFWQEDERLPHYTSSIDSALELVPEGFYVGMDTNGYAGVHTAGVKGRWYEAENVYSLALSICIAALKARQAQCAESSSQ